MLLRKRLSSFSALPSISGICASAWDGDRFKAEACALLLAGGVLGAPSLSPEKKLFIASGFGRLSYPNDAVADDLRMPSSCNARRYNFGQA